MAAEFKDIVFHLDDDDACAARTEVALSLAERFAAHLTGICVEHLIETSPAEDTLTPISLQDEVNAREAARINAIRERFDAAASRTAVGIEWRTVHRQAVHALAEQSHLADLLVAGQDHAEGRGLRIGPAVDSLVLSAACPVLLVPHIGIQRPVGGHVVIAWNGSREATRAIHDALPLLRNASSVEVASVGSRAAAPAPGSDITLHLSRLGISAELVVLDNGGTDAADALLSYAADTAADMMVMGAYGHSRVRELVLGGVTREVLRSMTIPVLLSH